MKTEDMSFGSKNPKYKGTLFIYGQVIVQDVLVIGDKLIEEAIQQNLYKVIEFPMVRKLPIKEDHIHIIIRPKFNIISLDDHVKTLKERILCKQLIEIQDIS